MQISELVRLDGEFGDVNNKACFTYLRLAIVLKRLVPAGVGYQTSRSMKTRKALSGKAEAGRGFNCT